MLHSVLRSLEIDPALVIPVIEEGLKVEKLNLESNRIIGNKSRADEIKEKIYQTELLLSILRLDSL